MNTGESPKLNYRSRWLGKEAGDESNQYLTKDITKWQGLNRVQKQNRWNWYSGDWRGRRGLWNWSPWQIQILDHCVSHTIHNHKEFNISPCELNLKSVFCLWGFELIICFDTLIFLLFLFAKINISSNFVKKTFTFWNGYWPQVLFSLMIVCMSSVRRSKWP